MKRIWLAMTAAAVLLGGGAAFPLANPREPAAELTQEASPRARAMDAAMGILREDSLYRRAIGGLNEEERRAETRTLAFRGLGRLEDGAIVELARFRYDVLTALPAERCASLADGDLGLPGIGGELTALDSARVYPGYRIIAETVRRQLHGTPPRRAEPTEREVFEARAAVGRRLPSSDSARFTRMADPTEASTATVEERCWFNRTLLREALDLEAPHRMVLLRHDSFASPHRRGAVRR